MNRYVVYGRLGLIALLLLILVLFVGVLVGRATFGASSASGAASEVPASPLEAPEQSEDAAPAAPKPQREPEAQPEPEPQRQAANPPTPADIEFTGTQDKASDPFELSAGLARVEVIYEGQGYISVNAFDEAGESYFLLGEDGPINMSIAEPVETAGTYVLEVDADAPWTVRVKQ